jgi:hypothetical protein
MAKSVQVYAMMKRESYLRDGFAAKVSRQEIWRTVGLRRVTAFEFSPASQGH